MRLVIEGIDIPSVIEDLGGAAIERFVAAHPSLRVEHLADAVAKHAERLAALEAAALAAAEPAPAAPVQAAAPVSDLPHADPPTTTE